FRTTVSFATTSGLAELTCALHTGTPVGVVAPLPTNVRCAKLVHAFLEMPLTWSVGKTLASCRPRRLAGRDGGAELVRLIRDPERTLPLVVVSERERFAIHPALPDDLAKDLAALATVVSIDESASWTMTAAMGREWSCYNGAVRVYWPFSAGRI